MCLHSEHCNSRSYNEFSCPSSSLQHNLWPHLLLLLQGFRNPPLCPTGTLLCSKAGLGTRRAAFRGRWWMHSSSSALLLCCWALGVVVESGIQRLWGQVAQKASGLVCVPWCKARHNASVLSTAFHLNVHAWTALGLLGLHLCNTTIQSQWQGACSRLSPFLFPFCVSPSKLRVCWVVH